MRILLTGGAGFIGSHVADALLADRHALAIIDDLSSGREGNLPDCPFHRLDIRDPSVAEVFAQFQPDVLVHHAAQISVRRSVEDPALDADINVVGSLKLFELCVKHKVGRVVFASTGGAIYGEQDEFPAPESHRERPLSPYGVAKLAVESYLHYYAAEHGLQPTLLRYANVYGPRQDPHGEAGVVAIFSKKLLANEPPTINGDGEQTRDYVYVGDVVEANCQAIKHGLIGAFNVGTGCETSVNEIYRALRDAVGTDAAAVHGPAKSGEQRRSVISGAKLTQATGWRPATALEQGVAQTVQFFRDHPDR